MTRLSIVVFYSVALVSIVFAPLTRADGWDAKTQFSIENNPNGTWTYGFTDAKGVFKQFNKVCRDDVGLAGWSFDGDPDLAGNITLNYSDLPVERYGAYWESGEMCIRSGLRDLLPTMRWTAPTSGSFHFQTIMKGRTIKGTAATVMIVRNGNSLLFSGNIQGFVGKGPNRKDRRGQIPELTQPATLQVSQGETVDFIVASAGEPVANQVGLSVIITR